jgi:VWFA-related protein
MVRLKLALVMCAAVLAIAAQKSSPLARTGDLVELAVVALDKNDTPVSDLRREDFQVKEDGHVMDVKTFAHIVADDSQASDDGRSVTLLLDDIGIPMAGTATMRLLAQMTLAPAGSSDSVAVVRLSRRSDEAFGDFGTARERIDAYHGGMTPFSSRDTPAEALQVIARTARQLEADERRRKVIVCIGLRTICDVLEPSMGPSSFVWPTWIEAIAATSRANVAVYAVDPTGLNAYSASRPDGISELTGGQLFANTNDLERAIHAIWRDASQYYALGYWPSSERRETHRIEVKVTRKNVRVRARSRRVD